MSKAKRTIIEVKGSGVAVLSKNRQDYISLTDIARHKDAERTDYLIFNWLRNRNTIEFLGIWERLYGILCFHDVPIENRKSSIRNPGAIPGRIRMG